MFERKTMAQENRQRRPEWLKVKLPGGAGYSRVKGLVHEHKLNTVCEDARCPNIGRPPEYDLDEPRRIAEAIRKLGLKYAVITSVDRDDLKDGGASIFAETIRKTRDSCPGIRIEVLIPDFQGSAEALLTVVEAVPDVLGHNVETVPRLYPLARAGSRYQRSLNHLANAKSFGIQVTTKSGIMLGLGESRDEILAVLKNLREADVDIVTLGQYLQPTRENLPVEKFYTPEEFREFRDTAYSMGFRHVASGPLVRSSYHAHEQSVESGT
jgi:lipoic acid synthetase